MSSFLKRVLSGLRPGRKKKSSKTLAVLGYFDKSTEDFICSVKNKTALSICETGELVLSRPHITFLITDDRGIKFMEKRLEGMLKKSHMPAIRFSHIGYFPSSGVVFLGITPTYDLMRFHEMIASKFEGTKADISPYYLPSKWVPHCSIAEGVQEISIKTDIYKEILFPFEAKVERLLITEMDHNTGKVVESTYIHSEEGLL